MRLAGGGIAANYSHRSTILIIFAEQHCSATIPAIASWFASFSRRSSRQLQEFNRLADELMASFLPRIRRSVGTGPY